MWIATDFGFFSVVQKDDEDFLTVRARVRDDLDALRLRCSGLGPTIDTPLADYGFRATVSHQDFGAALASIGSAINYHNFKDAVAARQGYERASCYGEVWSALMRLTRLNPVRRKTAAR